MTEHRLDRMTQAEMAARLPGNPVILLPLGSQEGQGPRCPMGDYHLADRLAGLVARETGALVAPVLPFGHAEFFRDYPGGIQLRAGTFTALLSDMLTSLADHGLTRLLILNGHTTNAPLIAGVCRDLRRATGTVVASVDLWPSVPGALMAALFGEAPVRGHGGEPVTSVAMHLMPGEVRDLAEGPRDAPGALLGLPLRGVSGADFHGLRVNLPVQAAEIAADGRLAGSGAHATAEKGAAITADLVTRLSALVRHMQGQAPTGPDGKDPS